MVKRVLLVLFFLSSCNSSNFDYKKYEFKNPVIVVSINKSTNISCFNGANVDVMDGEGKIYSFGCNTRIAKYIYLYKNVGDTLR